jgi:hypothetical protein
VTSYGTTLPGAPADGDTHTLVDSLTAATYQWTFRYNAARATNKWEFVGGAPAAAEASAAESVNSTSYVATATPCAITLPVAGDYIVGIGFRRTSDVSAQTRFMSYDIGGTAAADTDSCVTSLASGGSALQNVSRFRKKTGLGAVTLTAKYRGSAAGGESVQDRWMQVTPIAVGG